MSLPGSPRPKFDFVLTEEVRLLVVVAEIAMRDAARLHLRANGVTVETAAGADEAMHRLATESFDLALIDYDLPGQGGLSMIRELRQKPALQAMPIVVMTAHDDLVPVNRSYAAGATSFVTKPLQWPLVSCHLRYVLRAQGLIAA